MALPPGVMKLNEGEPCPPKTLCMYEHPDFKGVAYGVGAGYSVNLSDLACEGCAWGPTMAKNVSSWNNGTDSTAELIEEGGKSTKLGPGETINRGPTEDKIVKIVWAQD
jgi:hypothetical protein